jgi:hypothetical protein
MQQRSVRRRAWTIGLAVAAVSAAGVGAVLASDHQDTPLVELNPRMDMTDVYVFPGSTPDRITLVMNTSAFLTPAQTAAAGFDPSILYQFKIDNTGDAKEDKVIQVTFNGNGSSQKVQVVGPVAPPVQGAMMNTLATSSTATINGTLNTPFGSATALQAFAGPRDDPFFIDLEQFFRILPDRRPSTGPLSVLRPPSSKFRSATEAKDFLRGINDMAIVIELPAPMLSADRASLGKVGVWGTTSRARGT